MTDGFTLSAAIANEQILQALHDLNHVDQFTRRVDLSGIPSKSHDIGLWPRLTSNSVAEAVDLTATQVTSSKATVTASERGIMVVPTDALNLSSLAGMQDFARACAEALAEEEMGNVAALSSGFSNQVGATTVNLTEQNVLDGIATLANNRQSGQLRGLLYPQQWFDYIVSVGSSFTPAASTGKGAREEGNEYAHSDSGFQKDHFGVEWFTSTAVPTATAGADSSGMLVNPMRAIAYGVKYRSRVEIQRDASMRATEIVVTAFDGVAEIEDAAGVQILSDR
jgi:hypothetical protein